MPAPSNTPTNKTERQCVCAAAVEVLAHCRDLIEQLDDNAYTVPSTTIIGGTVGKHLRHTMDHFTAALEATDKPIDYDHRDREVPMETDKHAACKLMGDVSDALLALSDDQLARPIQVRVMLTGDGSEATLDSTLAREIFFAMHHAIHHNAMIKAIAREFGVEVSGDFGKAPSTINFEQSRA